MKNSSPYDSPLPKVNALSELELVLSSGKTPSLYSIRLSIFLWYASIEVSHLLLKKFLNNPAANCLPYCGLIVLELGIHKSVGKETLEKDAR